MGWAEEAKKHKTTWIKAESDTAVRVYVALQWCRTCGQPFEICRLDYNEARSARP